MGPADAAASGAPDRVAAVRSIILGGPATAVGDGASAPGDSHNGDLGSDGPAALMRVPEAELTRVIHNVIAAHVDESRAIPVRRRRSTAEFLYLSLSDFWAQVEAHINDHHAVQILMRQRPELAVTYLSESAPLHHVPVLVARDWLQMAGTVQGAVWDRPVELLARLVAATMQGLIIEYLHCRDSSIINGQLKTFSYHLAQHSNRIRPAKS